MSVEPILTSPAEEELITEDEAWDIVGALILTGAARSLAPHTELIGPDPEDLLPQEQWELLQQARDGELFDNDGTQMNARVVWELDEDFDEQIPRVTIWRVDEPF